MSKHYKRSSKAYFAPSSSSLHENKLLRGSIQSTHSDEEDDSEDEQIHRSKTTEKQKQTNDRPINTKVVHGRSMLYNEEEDDIDEIPDISLEYQNRNVDKTSTHNDDEDLEAIYFENIINEDYIINAIFNTTKKQVTYEDLNNITTINLRVDTSQQSIFVLPELLPSLRNLYLDNSQILTIRDLGTQLKSLLVLSLVHCNLKDLDGISVLSSLEELNVADNYITDISPLALHENLQTLNISGNRISDLSFGDVLSSCFQLKNLYLHNNLVSQLRDYVSLVQYMIPQVEFLDGKPLNSTTPPPPMSVNNKANSVRMSHSLLMENIVKLKELREEYEEEQRMESTLFSEETTKPTASSTTATNTTNHTATTSTSNEKEMLPDTGSELTHGSAVVLAGNVAHAIRKRRHNTNNNDPPSAMNTPHRNNHNNQHNAYQNEDFESALQVLDAAAMHNRHPSNHHHHNHNNSSANQSMIEGDITELLLPLTSPNRQQIKNIMDLDNLSRPAVAQSPNIKSSQHNKSRPGTANNNNNTNNNSIVKSASKLSISTNNMMIADNFEPSPSALLSVQKRPKSAFSGSTLRFTSSSAAADNNAQGQGNGAMKSARGKSPSTKLVSKSMPHRDYDQEQGIDEGNMTVRPKTSSNVRGVGSAALLISSSVNTAREKEYHSSDDDNDDSASSSDLELPTVQLGKRVIAADVSNSAKSQNSISSSNVGGNIINHAVNIINSNHNNNHNNNNNNNSSIVHLDIVKRNKDTSSSLYSNTTTPRSINTPTTIPVTTNTNSNRVFEHINNPYIESTMNSNFNSNVPSNYNSQSEGESADEDIAITHSERIKMMSKSHGTNMTHSNTSLLKNRQDVLLKLRNINNNNTSTNGSTINSSRRNSELSILDSERSISSRAGISLGFNLTNSLAAIDQWVQDVSSDEDTKHNKQHNTVKATSNGKTSTRTVDTEEDFFVQNKISSHKPPIASSASHAILSRDQIINMCANSTSSSHNNEQESIEHDQTNTSKQAKKQNNNEEDHDNKMNNNVEDALNDIIHPQKTSKDKKERRSNKASADTTNSNNNTAATTGVSISKNKVPKDLSTAAAPGQDQLAIQLTDAQLVQLLRRPPKETPQLRTKSSFQHFFKGISSNRFQALLQQAYANIEDSMEREQKIQRRLALMEGTLN